MKATPRQKAFTGLMSTLLFAVTLITGLMLHAWHHSVPRDSFQTLKLAHWIPGILMVGFAALHIAQFRKMLRGMKARFRWFWHDTRLVLLLTVVTLATGLIKLVSLAHIPHLGLWHYGIGLALAVLVALHLIRGIPSYRRLRSIKR